MREIQKLLLVMKNSSKCFGTRIFPQSEGIEEKGEKDSLPLPYPGSYS
jgi:hypothetical protein